MAASLSAVLVLLCGYRLRRTCAQRLRLTCRLAPLAQERHFLFGALPPALSSMVLCRLDSTSLKALRTVSRKTRLSVSGHVQRLHLDSAGVRRFTYTPISLIFPSLRELCLGRDVGLRALQGLLAMGGLQQLQVLDMLDASRCAPCQAGNARAACLLSHYCITVKLACLCKGMH